MPESYDIHNKTYCLMFMLVFDKKGVNNILNNKRGNNKKFFYKNNDNNQSSF